MRVNELGVVLVLLIPMIPIACKDPTEPPKKIERPKEVRKKREVVKPAAVPEGERIEVGNAPRGTCRRTLCISGPGPLDSEPNRDLAELCRRSPGVVMRCDGKLCESVWAVDRWQAGLDALVGTLDANADGRLDGKGGACPVSLAGWSTGAVVAAETLPKALRERIEVEIHNVVAIAPYAVGRDPQTLEIPAGVKQAFIYRHTVAPEDDCSRAYENGPWLSGAPLCAEGTTCYDYDYSDPKGDLAYLSRRGARSWAEINHCNIVSVVARIGLDNLARGQESYKELLPPYSDGTHGGRTRLPGKK